MKNLIAILALVMVSQANAQTGQGYGQASGQGYGQGQGGQGYGGQGYGQAAGQNDGRVDNAVIVPVQPTTDTQAGSTSAAGNQIYILNNQRQGSRQGVVQEQPVSVVQEAPLKASPADAIRKRRQGEESNTEDGIVQALERARMDDEIKRRDKFNNAIGATQTAAATVVGDNNSVTQNQVIQQPAVQVQQPVQQVVPVAVAQPKKKIHIIQETEEESADDVVEVEERPARHEEKVDVRGEIRAAFDEHYKKPEEKQSYYVGGLAAFGNYDSVINVNRSLGWGLVIGTQTAERFVAEGIFSYGDYQLEDVYNGWSQGGYSPVMIDMRQMNFGFAGKYVLLPGRFRPAVGAELSYTRRTYSFADYDFRTTDALDAAGVIGADLMVTENFSIGVDFRYFTNLGYRSNSNGNNQSFVYAQQRNDPEKLDYYMINMIGKFMF